jgi:DNA polymerase III delta' subunit
MLEGRVPHAVLLVGPAAVGKVSLALDLAAGLLCTGAAGGGRPCRACRACRMVEHGNHPDLHVLAPEGAGGQVVIGGQASRFRGVRDLVTELSLLPVEGVARVAIVRDAHRMNADAQSALLKTLEEPLPATTLILCADDEEQLLPTVRSRCARLRLGTVAPREIERLLGERGLADAPTAARLARLTGGRPGLAVAYAAASGAAAMRGELSRTLLDMLGQGRATRLAGAKDLLRRAGELAALLASPVEPAADARATDTRMPRGRAATTTSASVDSPAPDAPDGDGSSGADAAEATPSDEPPAKVTATERRRALAILLEAWRDLARDLVLVERGAGGAVRDPSLLEELEATARRLPPGAAASHLADLARADELLEGNVTPELVLDVLLLRWPGRRRAA